MTHTAKPQVTDHLGQLRNPNMKFFANPSPKIGRVLSAESSWSKTKKPSRVLEACTYVGEAGAQLIEAKKRAEKLHRDEVVLWSEAFGLRMGLRATTQGGFYQWHGFEFTWYSPDRKKLLENRNLFREKSGHPTDIEHGASLYRFGCAAEAAWTGIVLARVNEQFQQQGYIDWPMWYGDRALRLGKGYVEFGKGKKTGRIEGPVVTLDAGHWTIAPPDAARGMLGPKGAFTCKSEDIFNARAFTICVQKLM